MSDPTRDPPSLPPDGLERRVSDRFDVTWSVDCATEDTFLYAAISNISQMGIFVRTTEPLLVGTRLALRFDAPGVGAFDLQGVVQWVNPVRENGDNPNPGMGIRFLDLSPDDRERIVEVIHTIAYVRSLHLGSDSRPRGWAFVETGGRSRFVAHSRSSATASTRTARSRRYRRKP